MADTEPEIIVYGVSCVWWDSVDKASSLDFPVGKIPCCPKCHGLLFQTEEESWNRNVQRWSIEHNLPDYPNLIKWMRGKCFPGMEQAERAYLAQKAQSPD